MTGIMTQKELLEGWHKYTPVTATTLYKAYLKEKKEKKNTRKLSYQDYDNFCYVEDEITTVLRFDKTRQSVDYKGVNHVGWWVYETHHKCSRTPSPLAPVPYYRKGKDGRFDPEPLWKTFEEFEHHVKRLPTSFTTTVVAKDEPWFSDAEKRRGKKHEA